MKRAFTILTPSAAKKLSRTVTRFKIYTERRAKGQFDRLIADVEAGCVVDITRRGKAIASILSNDKLEMLEILANPEAMRAIRAAKKPNAAEIKKPQTSRGKGEGEML